MSENSHVATLVIKAADAKSALDALQFSQAACNVANALLSHSDAVELAQRRQAESMEHV